MNVIAKVGSRGLGNARGFEREQDDFYPTDVPLIQALLDVEKFPKGVWEPACGDGAISKLLRKQHISTTSTDLIYRGYGKGGIDFLTTKTLRKPDIITNPPFKLWKAFAQHSLNLGARKVALLGRLLMLEGWDRSTFFQQTKLSRVWIVGRGKMLPPGADDKGHVGMICFAWFIWQCGHSGQPVVNWKKPEKI